MKPFIWRIVICLLPILLAAYAVGHAWSLYQSGEGGFKLGVDLVGGTILVYEVDLDKFPERKLPENYKPEELAAAIKRRIDPTDLYNVTIRPISSTRVEIILPTGGAHQADIEEKDWNELIQHIKEHWPELEHTDLDISRGHVAELVSRVQEELGWHQLLGKVKEKWPKLKDVDFSKVPAGKQDELIALIQKEKVDATEQEIKKFVGENYQPPAVADIEAFVNKYKSGKKRKDVTAEEVERIKGLIKQVGSLEFRILANDEDDKDAIAYAQEYFKKAQSDPTVKAELEKLAREGQPPPPLIRSPEGEEGFATTRAELGRCTYTWVELGRQERKSLGLDNAAEPAVLPPVDTPDSQVPDPNRNWFRAYKAREKGEAILLPESKILLYSRKCQNSRLGDERQKKKYEYFLLVRDPEKDPHTGVKKAITGAHLVSSKEDVDRTLRPAVAFKFDAQGGDLFYEVTDKNRPTGVKNAETYRNLAIILDGEIMSAPRLITAIRTDGQITGNFTKKEVDNLVSILRAGQLPATLKQMPVSENTIGPTLGSDTIQAGTFSVGLAFATILVFMVVYYRFAGVVACVALLANLLLTVGFMVLVNATFTLPGLAGLVLMLGMAVDANVLIYERLREERDRGASLALAIRNGYDRAFPTIIDTHLSSIFTAIVLYAVGNDQLKGFGVSLTVGLIISLFTSLYMTRLMFDIWLAKGWLHKLSMFRLLSRTNIDFMSIRYVMFAATVIISLVGVAVFLLRGREGLNIDFVGGTAYSNQLVEPLALSGDPEKRDLRSFLNEDKQKERLAVEDVKQLDEEGHRFEIIYKVGTPKKTVQIAFANPAKGNTPEERAANVKERAQSLPDWSVEQIILSNEDTSGGKSRFFTIRTSEKEPDLVQVTVDRLLREQRDGNWNSLLRKIELKSYDLKGKEPILAFSDYASPGQVKMLLERVFANAGVKDQQPVEVRGEGKSKDGRYQEMTLTLSDAAASAVASGQEKDTGLRSILDQLKNEFEARPQPERLENFDSALAAETQRQAMYAILWSWGAILLYLWFRFGNWTFGLAAVLCLIHDLCFTLGAIALCHFVHHSFPALAHVLGIQDFKIDLTTVAALLTLVGYSVNDTIVVFDRIREVRGKNPELTPQTINDSVNQTLSRTLLTAFSVWLVVIVLYIWGGEGVHLFAFVMVAGVIVGTYSSIYIASPLLLIFGEGSKPSPFRERRPVPAPEGVPA